MTGLTLDTGALIALEAGNSRRVAVRVEEAVAAGTENSGTGGSRRPGMARRRPPGEDRKAAAAQGDVRCPPRCQGGASGGYPVRGHPTVDIVDVSVAICASDRGHAVITSDPEDIAKIDPSLTLIRPM